MGGVCEKCSSVDKAPPADKNTASGGRSSGKNAVFDQDDSSEVSEDEEEVEASSDDEDNEADMKKDVEHLLAETGNNLKRGKTLAMKEALQQAKKTGLDQSKIDQAEALLDEHKKKQLREEAAEEVNKYFESSDVSSTKACEKVLKRAKEAACDAEVVQRVQDQLDLLILQRPLEDSEVARTRDYAKISCREFVREAVKRDGRAVRLLELKDDKFVSAFLSLDPPLCSLNLVREGDGSGNVKMALSSLRAASGTAETKINVNKAFQALGDEEQNCIVALQYEADGAPGLLCIQEPTRERCDRFKEAIFVLGQMLESPA